MSGFGRTVARAYVIAGVVLGAWPAVPAADAVDRKHATQLCRRLARARAAGVAGDRRSPHRTRASPSSLRTNATSSRHARSPRLRCGRHTHWGSVPAGCARPASSLSPCSLRPRCRLVGCRPWVCLHGRLSLPGRDCGVGEDQSASWRRRVLAAWRRDGRDGRGDCVRTRVYVDRVCRPRRGDAPLVPSAWLSRWSGREWRGNAPRASGGPLPRPFRRPLQLWLAPVVGNGSPRCAGAILVLLPVAAYVLVNVTSGLDWNFVIQKLSVLVVWLAAFAAVHGCFDRLRRGRPRMSARSAPCVALAAVSSRRSVRRAAEPRRSIRGGGHVVSFHPRSAHAPRAARRRTSTPFSRPIRWCLRSGSTPPEVQFGGDMRGGRASAAHFPVRHRQPAARLRLSLQPRGHVHAGDCARSRPTASSSSGRSRATPAPGSPSLRSGRAAC